MTADLLLDRLTKVKSIGASRWKACCPAHKDRSPSLAIRETDDGTVLLHCFAGCSVDEIVGAVGLTLEDLFPKHVSAGGQPQRRPWSAADLLHFVDREALIVVILASERLARGQLRAEDLGRLQLARERIAMVIQCLP